MAFREEPEEEGEGETRARGQQGLLFIAFSRKLQELEDALNRCAN